MAAFVFYQDFKEQLGKGGHNLSANTIKIALTNAAPNLATHAALADITQIATGGGYTGGAGGGVALTGVSYTEAGGVGTFVAADLIITASGGAIGPFRYAVYYNDSAASPADALIGNVDYGSSITLLDTETFTLDHGASIFTVT
jgi:hypothetical protein